jgi:molybdopterin-guanine dinucleotide biosynthesis protein
MNNNEEFDEEHALDMALNNSIKELQKVRIRFPNESDYVIVENFRLGDFESIEEYDKEIYGKYKGGYVMINKEDYFNTIL